MKCEEMIERAKQFGFRLRTSSIHNPKHKTVVLVKSDEAGEILASKLSGKKISVLVVTDEYEFIRFHNIVNRNTNCVHGCIDSQGQRINVVEGFHAVKKPDGGWLQMKHIGGVRIGRNVTVDPSSVIHRAVFDETVIGDEVKIWALCNIGHNSVIGNRSLVMSGVNIGGSCRIGEDCFLGLSCVILPHKTITDKVMVGAGSVVTRDITEPGVYFGSPAKRIRDWQGTWGRW